MKTGRESLKHGNGSKTTRGAPAQGGGLVGEMRGGKTTPLHLSRLWTAAEGAFYLLINMYDLGNSFILRIEIAGGLFLD